MDKTQQGPSKRKETLMNKDFERIDKKAAEQKKQIEELKQKKKGFCITQKEFDSNKKKWFEVALSGSLVTVTDDQGNIISQHIAPRNIIPSGWPEDMEAEISRLTEEIKKLKESLPINFYISQHRQYSNSFKREPRKLNDGPTINIDASCLECKHEKSEFYAIQGDSGCIVKCTLENREIGDTSWKTPLWCPYLKENIKP